MSDAAPDQLDALRRRAFGPNPDAADAAAAQRRLAELAAQRTASGRPDAYGDGMSEAQHGASTRPDTTGPNTTGPAATDPAATAPSAAGTVAADDGPAPGTPGNPDPQAAAAAQEREQPTDRGPSSVPVTPTATGAPPGSAKLSRRMRIAWAASLVATAVVVAGVTLALTSLPLGSVAVLEESADAQWPEEQFGSPPPNAVLFEEYYGLTTAVIPLSANPDSDDPTRCLYILASDGVANVFSGGGCTAGVFPATANIVVSADAPGALLERFPEGTGLQFVLEGDRVTVYAAAP